MTHTPPPEAALLDGHSPLLSRRAVLGGALTLAALGAGAAQPPPAAGAPASTLSDRQKVRLMMKLQSSLGAGQVPWFYSGSIFAARGASAPLHLVDFEGTEIYWVHPQAEDVWLVSASTLTFYRDVGSGAYLDEFANPLTGQTVAVKPNALRLPGGTGLKYSPAGIEAFGQLRPWNIQVHRGDPLMWIQTSRAAQGGPQPSMEISTVFATTAAVDDPQVLRAMSHFSSTTFSPWSRWMEMGDREGHLVWHAAGHKLASLAALPADYRARAERSAPAHFTDPYLEAAPAKPPGA